MVCPKLIAKPAANGRPKEKSRQRFRFPHAPGVGGKTPCEAAPAPSRDASFFASAVELISPKPQAEIAKFIEFVDLGKLKGELKMEPKFDLNNYVVLGAIIDAYHDEKRCLELFQEAKKYREAVERNFLNSFYDIEKHQFPVTLTYGEKRYLINVDDTEISVLELGLPDINLDFM